MGVNNGGVWKTNDYGRTWNPIFDDQPTGSVGDVVVAPFTNPAWTPLFARAVAVVVDAGSAMSHAAIVAREYGLPAVMGTRDALTRLQDGQLVTVDGTRGLVFPER